MALDGPLLSGIIIKSIDKHAVLHLRRVDFAEKNMRSP